jgi:enamine deaminase RidA (YjgF/YER057c/UK114 family)
MSLNDNAQATPATAPTRYNDAISKRHDPFPVVETYRGIYAHGVETRADTRILHVSGQVGVSPNGDLPPGFDGQCRNALVNLRSVLEAADMTFGDIVKMSFFLIRHEDMAPLADIRREYLDGVRPAITTIFVAGLVSPDWLVEVEAVACAGPR